MDRRPAEGAGEDIGSRLFGLSTQSFVTTPAVLAYSVLLQAEIRMQALPTVQASMPVCMFSGEVSRSTHGDCQQQEPLSSSANHIPSKAVVPSDASLTLKGLSFSVSVTHLVFYMYHLSVLCSVMCSWIL